MMVVATLPFPFPKPHIMIKMISLNITSVNSLRLRKMPNFWLPFGYLWLPLVTFPYINF